MPSFHGQQVVRLPGAVTSVDTGRLTQGPSGAQAGRDVAGRPDAALGVGEQQRSRLTIVEGLVDRPMAVPVRVERDALSWRVCRCGWVGLPGYATELADPFPGELAVVTYGDWLEFASDPTRTVIGSCREERFQRSLPSVAMTMRYLHRGGIHQLMVVTSRCAC
jgi:hypothetical protein